VRNYCEAACGTARLVDAMTHSLDPAKANQCADELHAHYLALRHTQAGRDAITSLMSHEDTSVRLWAAGHSLEWAPDAAQAVLEELRDSDGPVSFEAKWTLIEYHRGRLSFGPAAGGPAGAASQKGATEPSRVVVTWDRAATDYFGPNPGAGDRAARAMYSAHGLIMNGGVLNFVEIENDAELEAAKAGYRFFGFDGIVDLLSRAKSVVDRPPAPPQNESESKAEVSPGAQSLQQSDLDRFERQLDSDYAICVPDDSTLQERYEQVRLARPSDFADS